MAQPRGEFKTVSPRLTLALMKGERWGWQECAAMARDDAVRAVAGLSLGMVPNLTIALLVRIVWSKTKQTSSPIPWLVAGLKDTVNGALGGLLKAAGLRFWFLH
ncbi:hypothetical protein GH714_011957 [Hevea brasiliensis]|uniref:Uncharacterized protein n=1 Tax=Hevea brasiliensis TaxID=3981 RepID=A0A6A6KDJ9_HEVBR|nr:hypothetical protein GH714_011957 [Hevea brasiliensis]